MIAVFQQISLGAWVPTVRVHREPFDQIKRIFMRDCAFRRDQPQRIKGRVASCLTGQCPVCQIADMGQRRMGIMIVGECPAMFLPIGQIIAFAAPAIQQPCPFTRLLIEQPGRKREGFGTPRDALPRLSDKSCARFWRMEGDGRSHPLLMPTDRKSVV